MFLAQGPRDDVAHRLAHEGGAVTVVELAVVIAFPDRVEPVAIDGGGKDETVSPGNDIAVQVVKTVLINALALKGAVKTAQAAALEFEIGNIDDL